MKIKLGDMTINKRNKICQKQANCTTCPFHKTNMRMCVGQFWTVHPETEIEIDEEDLK